MKILFEMYDNNNHILKSYVYENYSNLNRTKKILFSLEELSKIWDFQNPIWLDKNINEFKSFSRTTFYSDNFIEEISFNKLYISVLEEDW